ncbi:MAG: hypothetical protein SWQ30_22505 [Thermodesulfobacteriota bacterium]|nr:hypothetical protein [Thermodesulfobacteriota bacterium]
MEIASLVLEYIKAIISTQVVTGIAAILIVTTFKNDISALMSRIAKIKLPGGSEFSTTQLERTASASDKDAEEPPKPTEEKVDLPNTLQLNESQVEIVANLFKAERANAVLWEYRFLNYFLALHTQRVLDWISNLPSGTSISLFHGIWTPGIPNANERNAIVNALQAHFLIQITGDFMEITPKGREYVNWRGPLPKSGA